jgi:hypothetical protein
METGHRFLLIAAELIALGVILVAIPGAGARLALGLIVAAVLVRTAWIPGGATKGPPEGLPDRRGDHLFRHWLDVLIKKVREFHTVCEAVREERVNSAVGEMRVREIETELRELMAEITDLAKPPRMRRGSKPRPADVPVRRRRGEPPYGKSVSPE